MTDTTPAPPEPLDVQVALALGCSPQHPRFMPNAWECPCPESRHNTPDDILLKEYSTDERWLGELLIHAATRNMEPELRCNQQRPLWTARLWVQADYEYRAASDDTPSLALCRALVTAAPVTVPHGSVLPRGVYGSP